MAKSNNIIVQLNAPKDRLFVKVYHDFLYSNLLTADEKIIFIVLKSFLDFSKDKGGIQENTYKSIDDICKVTQWGNQKVVKIIKNLVKKGVVKKIRQGLTKPNIYTISDFPAMWAVANEQEMKQAIEQGQTVMDLRKYSDEDLLKEIERRKKEKGLETEPTKAQNQAPNKNISDINKDNTNKPKSQGLERYTINQIHQLFDYDIMLQDNPYRQNDIDSAMSVLYTAMNTTKATIRIAGENKPSMVVIGKLMKLDKESIMYAIEKFSTQTERIKNPTSYLLTVLYFAPEQFHLDIQNQVSHDMAHWNTEE